MADAQSESRPVSYIAAFRTHFWNADAAAMAVRMHANCRQGRFVVLADETNGPVHAAPYEKIALSADLTGIGIPTQPADNTLWYSGDHALYVLLHALPRHDYYLMSEYDVQVNTDLDAMIDNIAARDLDFVAAHLRHSQPDWYWHENGLAHFAEPWAILFAFVIVSRRALERLYATRLAHAARLHQGDARPWAHCETFVPSVMKADAEMRCADLSEFVELPLFSAFNPTLLGSPWLETRGTLAHPVLGYDRFISRLFRFFPPADYMDQDSPLYGQLNYFRFDEVLPHLRDALERVGDQRGMQRLLARLRGETWIDPDVAARDAADIARGKPALQSSLAVPWSLGRSLAEDAGNVVAPELAGDYAHHTDTEEEPWWQVDLQAPFVIAEVEVLNRPDPLLQERLNAYFLLGSLDGESWTCMHFRPIGPPVSGRAAKPECIALPHRPVARYVRLQLPGRGFLNLRRVRVFGEPAP